MHVYRRAKIETFATVVTAIKTRWPPSILHKMRNRYHCKSLELTRADESYVHLQNALQKTAPTCRTSIDSTADWNRVAQRIDRASLGGADRHADRHHLGSRSYMKYTQATDKYSRNNMSIATCWVHCIISQWCYRVSRRCLASEDDMFT